MTWIEIIKLRTSAQQRESIRAELKHRLEGAADTPGLEKTGLFSHAHFPDDLLVTLSWRGDAYKPEGSRLGLSLALDLRQYGLVDHSVWRGRELRRTS